MRSAHAALAVLVALSGAAAAQGETPLPPDTFRCEPGDVCPQVPRDDDETLSDRLQETDGVIAPPTEPFPTREIVPPDPDPQTTPVIDPDDLPEDMPAQQRTLPPRR